MLEGLKELGVPILTEPNNGTNVGGMLIPNNMHPENQTRSDARLAYFDDIINTRPNFHVTTRKHVYRLILDNPQGNLLHNSSADVIVRGVEVSFSSSESSLGLADLSLVRS